MIRSGDRAARSALLRALMSYAAMPLDLCLQFGERRRLRAADPSPPASSATPMILIIGPPRSGTTLVYQTLGVHLPVYYFSNLTEMFPRSPISAIRLFGSVRRKTAGGYHSFYGNTAGLFAPNDAFHIWNRFLGADRYHGPSELSEDARREMRRFFDVASQATGLPLLNKNNRNTDCVALLAEALPNARFVVLSRDPAYIIQSLLKARSAIQGNASYGWGLRSRDSDPEGSEDGEGGEADAIAAVCEQVREIDVDLREQLGRIDAERIIHVEYEDFCAHPAKATARIGRQFLGAEIDEAALSARIGSFDSTNRITVSPDQFERIQRFVGKNFNLSATASA